MIFSIIVKNIKTHQNLNYLPISNSSYFSALIGENGVGKSSILEALDSYFNNTEWNVNNTVIEKGHSNREPVITPIFIIPKASISDTKTIKKDIEALSSKIWDAEISDFNSANIKLAKQFCTHRDLLQTLSPEITKETHFLFPLGLKQANKTTITYTLSIFDSFVPLEQETLSNLKNFLLSYYKFIYFPSDIDLTAYTKIEGETIQALMGQKIDTIVKRFIKDADVKEINKKLNEFVEEVSQKMDNKYTYKKPSKRQDVFNRTHFTSKVVEAYFETKVLNYHNSQEQDIPVYNLSSGEKRQALIDVATAFLKSTDSHTGKQVIFGIDEPEISLHTSACFEQFDKLRKLSDCKVQTIITTHWYGFMPAISNGSATYLSTNLQDEDGNEIFSAEIINLASFRDDFKRLKTQTQGTLPSDIALKGINDLVQSIISSITNSQFKWLICEGTSDKIYLESLLQREDIFVLPIGKSKNVKKIFNYLYLALEEDRDEIKGRVFLLLDTDKQYEKFDAKDSIKSIRIRRLQNCNTTKQTTLVPTSSTNFYPPTEIEDTLDANNFYQTLNEFSQTDDFKETLTPLLLELRIEYPEAPSGIAFDLKESQKQQLESFFDAKGIKTKFARRYSEIMREKDQLEISTWVTEIINFLDGKA